MGLFHSVLSLCPCSTPPKTAISPEVISHPYPLAPKSRTALSTAESRFRPHPINPHSANSRGTHGPYRQLESPSHSHNKTVSESTTSTAPRPPLPSPPPLILSDGRAIDGLGLGLGDWNLRPPDRAYILAERPIVGQGGGTGSTAKGRKLKKTRLVEGDWELVRTDHLEKEGRSKRMSTIEVEKEEVNHQLGNDDERTRTRTTSST